ncbi:MAG: ABC transporter permease [Oscillospiraceae bacterium]|nr:ABC transporter permease [Oscillospiraceae bacterium]
MLRYIGKRLLMLIPVLIAISLVVLIIIDLTPGDPARILLGTQATEEQVQELRDELGLNDPFFVRWWNYITGIITRGDFGTSMMTKRPVAKEMLERFRFTLFLVIIGTCFAVCVGIPVGIFAATHQHTWKDSLAIFLSLIAISMPGFWFSLLVIRLFGVKLQILPISGVDTWKGWILPCISMALGTIAMLARQMRSDMLETLRQDYIITARAKGLSERRVVYRHALKNALIPVITIVGGMFGGSLGGSLITEVIFSIPGLGQYTMTGLNNRDYPVIQSSILIISCMFSVILLIVDLLYAVVDPRIRSQFARKKAKGKEKKDEDKKAEETVAAV